MKKLSFSAWIIFFLLSVSCKTKERNTPDAVQIPEYNQGEFGYDLLFLKKQDTGLVVLEDGDAQLIISPKYQAKVFTSTARGERGFSFGWINYKAFQNLDMHMNAYGGENRLWLGPEGGKFSLFFMPGSKMEFKNWKTPSAIDTESWSLEKRDSNSATMQKDMQLLNYNGTSLLLRVSRTIKILKRQEIFSRMDIPEKSTLYAVGYQTENQLTNKGKLAWTNATGMPCIWMLDMFKPSASTVIAIPFQPGAGKDNHKMVTTNYFGEIPPDRLKHLDSLVLFRADGKSRGKMGIVSGNAKQTAGSYDADNRVLTIILFEVDKSARYLNQEWNLSKPVFSGDAVNAYNDGPLADGSQMGPFYEIESVSPAAFLKPEETIAHKHTVFHFTGNEKDLDALAIKNLGISLEKMTNSFSSK